MNQQEIANNFAKFFKYKVTSLLNDAIKLPPFKPPNLPLTFSLSEMEIAMKSQSNKKSFSVDGVPQNLFKDTSLCAGVSIINTLNSFARKGLPDDLKTARVIPLHKKGSKLEISNFRPISNLSIFSKVYEKC